MDHVLMRVGNEGLAWE